MAPKAWSNAELARYRDKQHAVSSDTSSGTVDKLLRLLLQLIVVTLWKSLKGLSVPLGRLFAVWLWAGRSMVNFSLFLERSLLRFVGFMSGTAVSARGVDGRHDYSALARQYFFVADVKRWHIGLALVLLGGVVTSVARAIKNQFDERVRKSRWLKQLMRAAMTYDEWRKHALQLEQHEAEDRKRSGGAPHEDYDRKLLMSKLVHLQRTRSTGNPREMMLALRIDLIRNVANIAKSQKHRQNFVSVPEAIQQYIREVQQQLDVIALWPETELPLEEKASFFKVTRHAFGRTALLLSGGGGLGTFHLGVCKALFERKMLPRVLAGSSVGSIVCAVVGTRTDLELKRTFANLEKFDIGFFQNSTALALVRHAMNKGHLQDISFMITKLRQLLGDCTFLEAFERTGRILNVTVCPADTNEPPRLLNYMTAPQALVWSAVAASSSFPGLYPPQYLLGRNSLGEIIKLHAHGGSEPMQRRWRDGSLEFDLPVQTLAEMFNCNHFLVSQTNPHIVPLLNFKAIFSHKWANIMEAELKHRLQVVQWLLPEWKVSKYLTLFTQPWEGDVTFTLPSMLYNLKKTIINPSTSDLMRATQVGEQATWERMAAIECNCTIEATLDLCAAKLSTRAARAGHSLAALGSKVPSWLHMPSGSMLGGGGGGLHGAVASSQSWGDGIADHDTAAQVASWGNFLSQNYEPAILHNSSSSVHLPPIAGHHLYYAYHSPAPTGDGAVPHVAPRLHASALDVDTRGQLSPDQEPQAQRLAGLVAQQHQQQLPPVSGALHRMGAGASSHVLGAAPRLPPIQSPSQSLSEEEEEEEEGQACGHALGSEEEEEKQERHDGFDSASSVAAAGTRSGGGARHALQTVAAHHGGSGLAGLAVGALGRLLHRRAGHMPPHGQLPKGPAHGGGAAAAAAVPGSLMGSGGLSRKSSVMRNLHSLGGGDTHHHHHHHHHFGAHHQLSASPAAAGVQAPARPSGCSTSSELSASSSLASASLHHHSLHGHGQGQGQSGLVSGEPSRPGSGASSSAALASPSPAAATHGRGGLPPSEPLACGAPLPAGGQQGWGSRAAASPEGAAWLLASHPLLPAADTDAALADAIHIGAGTGAVQGDTCQHMHEPAPAAAAAARAFMGAHGAGTTAQASGTHGTGGLHHGHLQQQWRHAGALAGLSVATGGVGVLGSGSSSTTQHAAAGAGQGSRGSSWLGSRSGGVGLGVGGLTEVQLLELARRQVPGATGAGDPSAGGLADNLWGVLLPLAGTCEMLTAKHEQQQQCAAPGSVDGLDARAAAGEPVVGMGAGVPGMAVGLQDGLKIAAYG